MTKSEFIGCMILTLLIGTVAIGGLFLLDREPIKERQQYVIIKSVGVEHKYLVDGKNVRVGYED
jgi:hypothetical protein